MKNRILLIGASLQSGMAVAKSLYDYGLEINIIDWYKLPIRNSRYIHKYIDIGNPSEDEMEFSERLIEIVKKGSYKCILPINDPAMEICHKHEREINLHTPILNLNPSRVYEFAHDKRKLLLEAGRHGIEIPESVFIENITDLNLIKPDFEFPCILKPAFSAKIKNNKILEFKVRIAESREHLSDLVRELIHSTPLIIQKRVRGTGIGFNLIAYNGEIINYYLHKRITEINGVSSYREIINSSTYNLETKIESLLKSIGWTGVAMIEFKADSNKAVLMEMNGRFWGSLNVGIYSGLNFPVQLYEMIVLNKKINKISSLKKLKVRNLHMEAMLYGSKCMQGKFLEFFKWSCSILFNFKRNEIIEDGFFRDPLHFVELYFHDLKRLYSKFIQKYSLITRNKLKIKSSRSLSIAFICHGNICRSPFAEIYSKKHFPKHSFASFGFVNIEERLPPLNAVLVAQQMNVDISNHLSRCFNVKEKSKYDAFIVMDRINYFHLIKLGVEKSRVYFISDKDIPDPYGKDTSVFLNTFNQIKQSLDYTFINDKP